MGAPMLSQQSRRASQMKTASSKGRQPRPAGQAVAVPTLGPGKGRTRPNGNANGTGGLASQ
eukprot:1675187-Lingulodinium_polyedra.AAC.1